MVQYRIGYVNTDPNSQFDFSYGQVFDASPTRSQVWAQARRAGINPLNSFVLALYNGAIIQSFNWDSNGIQHVNTVLSDVHNAARFG